MVSLARATLVHEWRRYLAAVLAITFAGLLIVVQLALLLGLFGSVAAVVDKSGAELWIGFRNTQSVDLGRPLGRGSDALAWSHSGAGRIEAYTTAYGDLRRPDGVPVSVLLHAMDVSGAGLVFSRLLTPAERTLLREPNAIIIDAADMRKLGAQVGTAVEINGRRARIAGVVDGIRSVGGVNVLASFATARYLAPETAEQAAFYLVRLKPGFDAHKVAADISDKARFPRYSVWTADALSTQSQAYWLLESGSGIGTGFASLLALVVGMVITSQTLSGAILASVKEFAALRALGVPHKSLRAIVVEQSLWVGVAGLFATGIFTLLIAWLGDALRISMRFPAWMLAGASGLLLAIAIVSGLLALRPLGRAEPASLLR